MVKRYNRKRDSRSGGIAMICVDCCKSFEGRGVLCPSCQATRSQEPPKASINPAPSSPGPDIRSLRYARNSALLWVGLQSICPTLVLFLRPDIAATLDSQVFGEVRSMSALFIDTVVVPLLLGIGIFFWSRICAALMLVLSVLGGVSVVGAFEVLSTSVKVELVVSVVLCLYAFWATIKYHRLKRPS